MLKKCIAEAFGTFVLVFMGCGSAIFAGALESKSMTAKILLISFAFGIAIIAAAYAIGNISGCHVNPAVSLSMLINGRMTVTEFCGYFISQVVGALLGSAALAFVMKFTHAINASGGLGQNGFGSESLVKLNWTGALIAEIIMTFFFIMTILAVTKDEKTSHMAGLIIGMTLVGIHIVGIPLTGTSVNPARSFAPAIILLLDGKTTAFSQLWVFIIGPFVGSALAGFAHKLLYKDRGIS